MEKISKIYEQIKKLFGCNKKSLSLTTYNVTFNSDWTSDWCNESPIQVLPLMLVELFQLMGLKISPKLLQQLTYQEWRQLKFKKTIG